MRESSTGIWPKVTSRGDEGPAALELRALASLRVGMIKVLLALSAEAARLR